jgi:hypothetical protein
MVSPEEWPLGCTLFSYYFLPESKLPLESILPSVKQEVPSWEG